MAMQNWIIPSFQNSSDPGRSHQVGLALSKQIEDRELALVKDRQNMDAVLAH